MSKKWTLEDSKELYHVDRWGAPYFSVNTEGNVECTPLDGSSAAVALKALIDDLNRRGLRPPFLLRFNDILHSRVKAICSSFQNSIKNYGYKGSYRAVMPIKVNQQRHVVEELIGHAEPFQIGLESGSKPELLVAMALLCGKGDILVCNGYKDREYVEIAFDAQALGLTPFIVMDRFEELHKVIQVSKERNMKPYIGIRAKLSTKGSGRWEESSGDRSKFGLTTSELLEAIELLKQNDLLDCLRLIHFHIGSQITNIRSVTTAIRECAHTYCNIRKMGAIQLDYVDIGGGLAVDYDGSKTNFHSSMNYSTQEYANDVIAIMQDICDASEEPHPNVISESGRALVAHHAVLVFNVLGFSDPNHVRKQEISAPSEEDHTVLHTMWEAYQGLSAKNCQEVYNDIVAAKEESHTLYNHGVINLHNKAKVDSFYWATCEKIQRIIKTLSYVPEDLEGLHKRLSAIYYCNFSVFQSLPDAWAVGHLFPIMPLHRLKEEPTKEAILADLTCDSDGKIDKFIDLRDVKETICLHVPEEQPYYLGAFLVGAYQEILGDLHNLFGDTNVVHVKIDDNGRYCLDHVVQGDTVEEVLSYHEYARSDLVHKIRQAAELAARHELLSYEEIAKLMGRYSNGLSGYTYLEDEEF